MLTSDINTITLLNINGKNIVGDLIGIEDFKALINLECKSNEVYSEKGYTIRKLIKQ